MALVVAIVFVLGVLVLATLTRRTQLRSCCSVADPRQDLRMRPAFEDEGDDTPGSLPTRIPRTDPSEQADAGRRARGNEP